MKTVLVIDDDASLRRTMQRMLRIKDYSTLTAENGFRGIELARSHTPDIIISDIQMELGDGYTVLQRLQEDPSTAPIPVILMTGESTSYAMRQSMELGADDYLIKPFTAEALFAAMEARFRKHAAVRAESEMRYRTLFESAGDAILLIQDGRCVDCNASSRLIFERPREELLGSSPLLFAPELQPGGEPSSQRAAQLTSAALEGRPQRFEWTHSRPGGACFDTEVLLQVLPIGRPPFLLAIIRDISARKQFERTLADSQQQLRKLLDRIQSVREDERTRLSRDLHDDLGQLLTALQLELAAVERRVAKLPPSTEKAESLEKLSNSKRLAINAHRSVRDIAVALRPSALDQDFLLAVRQEIQTLEKRSESIRCRLDVPTTVPLLTEKQRNHLFRMFQELLTNAVRHSHANEISVRVAVQGTDLVLEVGDTGQGIPPEELSSIRSLGLLGVRERAEALGGQVRFGRNGAQGALVTVTVPLVPLPS